MNSRAPKTSVTGFHTESQTNEMPNSWIAGHAPSMTFQTIPTMITITTTAAVPARPASAKSPIRSTRCRVRRRADSRSGGGFHGRQLSTGSTKR